MIYCEANKMSLLPGCAYSLDQAATESVCHDTLGRGEWVKTQIAITGYKSGSKLDYFSDITVLPNRESIREAVNNVLEREKSRFNYDSVVFRGFVK